MGDSALGLWSHSIALNELASSQYWAFVSVAYPSPSEE